MAKAKRRGKAVPARGSAAGKASQAQTKMTKLARVIAMLKQPEGATVQALADATGWQAHSVRGAISGTIKKKLGLAVKSERRDNGQRVYSIV